MPLFKKNKEQDKEIAVIGLGHFGGSLARRLEALGHRVLGIDIDPRLVKEIADDLTEAVVLDAMDEEALQQVDITAFQTVVVAISGNFEANVLITSTLKKLGLPLVICESNSHRHREILLRIGADRVILPEEESGTQLADELSIPGMLETLPLSQDYSLIEIKTPNALVWLNRHLPHAERVSVVSNSEGARRAAAEADAATLGSEAAAELYKLAVVESRIEDESSNTTRFLVMGKADAAPSGRDKTSIVVGVHNQPGAVVKLLQPLADAGIFHE